MKDCIDECGDRFMDLKEIQDISEKIVKLMVDSDKRKTENEKYK